MIRATVAAVVAVVALLTGTARPAATPATAPHALAAAPTAPAATPVRIMALGDSITVGVHDEQGRSGYRGRLDGMIKWPHVWVGSQVDANGLAHEGHSGWKIPELQTQAAGWISTYRPAWVFLDAGTNDDGAGATGAQMLDSMRQLLQTIVDAAAAGGFPVTIVLAQITLTPYNTAGQQAEETAFDNGLPALAAQFPRVIVVDMRGVEISTDDVHPDAAGYLDMAVRWSLRIPAQVLTVRPSAPCPRRC